MDRPLQCCRSEMDVDAVRCCACARGATPRGALLIAFRHHEPCIRSVTRVGFVCSATCALEAWPGEETFLHPLPPAADALVWGERIIAEDDWPTTLVIDLFKLLASLRSVRRAAEEEPAGD